MSSNDNDPNLPATLPVQRDGHGQAALLLTESLVHGLCEKSLLSTGEAIEIVERAIDVQFDQAEAADGTGAEMWRSHALLSDIAGSLRTDVNDGPMSPHPVS